MSAITTTRLPASTCPSCGLELDATTGVGEPVPGDLSICGRCAEVLVFDKDLHQAKATAAELEALDDRSRAWLIDFKARVVLRRPIEVHRA